MAIKCGNCKNLHESVADVKACYSTRDQIEPSRAYDHRDPFEPLEGPSTGWSGESVPTARRRIDGEMVDVPMASGFARPQGRQRVPLSEKQRTFILSLSAERIEGWAANEAEVAEVDALSKSEASARISGLLALPKLSKPKAATPAETDLPEIPDGHYALAAELDGQVRFYSVKAGTGKWEGYTFVKGLIGSPGHWTEIKLGRVEREAVQRKIGADYMAALKLYADKFECCGFCDSPLSDPRSRAARYGEKCASNHGLHYPSKAEALALLGETA